MKLERKLDRTERKSIKEKIVDNPVYKYLVDFAGGTSYYTTAYALQELAVGKSTDEIIDIRTMGMLGHAIAMRPVGKLRNYVAKKRGVTKDSPFKDQAMVNLVSTVPIQAVVYAGMLTYGALREQARTGSYNLESSLMAFGVGMLLGIPHSVPAGFWQDKTRTFFGVKPAIKESQDSVDSQKEISEKDIRMVMEEYGESLSDLGANYSKEFAEWFGEKEPEKLRTWVGSTGDYCPEDFLYYFSNNSLEGLVYQDHDKHLSNFINQNPEAKRHVLSLLERLDDDTH